MRWRLALGLGIWLAGGVAFTAYLASGTHIVGRMELPAAQAAAIASSSYLATSLLVGWVWALVRWLLRRVGIGGATSFVELRPVRRVLLLALVVAVPLGLYARFVEPCWLVVREVPLGGAPPAGLAPVRVAVISDLHVAEDRAPISELAAEVNAARPDLILFLGDTLNAHSGLPVLRRTLAAMDAPHGKLAVWGNWEAWYWGHLPLLEGTGFRWLDREAVHLDIRGQRLHLTAGVAR